MDDLGKIFRRLGSEFDSEIQFTYMFFKDGCPFATGVNYIIRVDTPFIGSVIWKLDNVYITTIFLN